MTLKTLYTKNCSRTYKMQWEVLLVVVMVIKIKGAIISDYLTRNPLYDNRATMGTNVISTLNSVRRLSCASHCTTNPTCKSLLYNSITQYCQLLSVQMSPMSDNGPKSSTGWRYYERKIGKLISISFLNSILE